MGSCHSTVPKLKKKNKNEQTGVYRVYFPLTPQKKNNHHHRTCLAFRHLPCPLPGRPLPPFCHLASPCPAFRTQINSAASGEPPRCPTRLTVCGHILHPPLSAPALGRPSVPGTAPGTQGLSTTHTAGARATALPTPPSPRRQAWQRPRLRAPPKRQEHVLESEERSCKKALTRRPPSRTRSAGRGWESPRPPSRPQPSPSKAFRARLEPVSGDREAEMARPAGPARPLGALGKQRLQRGSPGPLTF